MKTPIVTLMTTIIILVAASVQSADFFVSKSGDDANDGKTAQTAFHTIQKGVDAMKTGNSLIIGPGEYLENVRIAKLGDVESETLVRAKIPGTAVLRGDRDLEAKFVKVPGTRFAYVADIDGPVLSVREVDTLTPLKLAGNVGALDFEPGRYFHDEKAGKLYVSSADFGFPNHHSYSIGTLTGNGFLASDCGKLVFDGLVARGFSTPVDKGRLNYPVSGFFLRDCERCVVRGCVAFFNGGGIVANDANSQGGNVIESCETFGNVEGITGYDPCGAVVRDCLSYLNRVYGARLYGQRHGDQDCLFADVVAWGNKGGDYWFKGEGLSLETKHVLAERCVAFNDCHILNIARCAVGERKRGGPAPPDSVDFPDQSGEFLAFVDREFADPLNFDFRPQANASILTAGVNGERQGPYSLMDDVRYLASNGDDANDGRSVASPWKTLDHAVKNLKSGDALFISAGRYVLSVPLGLKSVAVRGRGLDTPSIDGVTIDGASDVAFERMRFVGLVNVSHSENISFGNCVFDAVVFDDVKGVTARHNLLTTKITFRDCAKVDLWGNLFATAPSVDIGALGAMTFSNHNSYPKMDDCWVLKTGERLSFDNLRTKGFDVQSQVIVPELKETADGVDLENAWAFAGRGPLATSIGPYRRWRPKTGLRLIGPFVHSTTETTANIEWWTTLPAEVKFAWGEMADLGKAITIKQNSYYSQSLVGLKPATTYHANVTPLKAFADADPGHRAADSTAAPVSITFITATEPSTPKTYHVSTEGNDAADGLSPTTPWRTIQRAADAVNPGDTVVISGGVYPGAVYFRSTGTPERPITFTGMPGGKTMIAGMRERLKAGFVLFGKHDYRFDAIYFHGFGGIPDNKAEIPCGAMVVDGGSDLRVTRCFFSHGWGPCFVADHCPDILLKNCVFMHSMGLTTIKHCPGLRVENCVFTNSLISHITIGHGDYSVKDCVFGENTRGKVHRPFARIGESQSNNCFYTRWPETERRIFSPTGWTLPEYKLKVKKSDSFNANPLFPGDKGFRRGSGPHWRDYDFNLMFATNPKLLERGVGLQPEAFEDFHFNKEPWLYDAAWAKDVLAKIEAAEKLAKEGEFAEAADAYVAMTETAPMSDQLKANLLDRAAILTDQGGDFERAMELAKRIPDLSESRLPLNEMSIRRQMVLLADNGRFAELIHRFGRLKELKSFEWFCPDTEEPIADVLDARARAYVGVGDLDRAEKEHKAIFAKNRKYGYQPGPTILDRCWKRLGDFYRDHKKDDAKALDAYARVIDRNTLLHLDRPFPKPVLSGNDQVLVEAAEASMAILQKQGRVAEASQVKFNLLKAQAEADAFAGKRLEAVAKFKEAMALEGISAKDKTYCEKRIKELETQTSTP